MRDIEISCFLLGFTAGMLVSTLVAVRHHYSNSTLRAVGIERIEKCHNTHSNWYEIVWSDTASGKKEGGAARRK